MGALAYLMVGTDKLCLDDMAVYLLICTEFIGNPVPFVAGHGGPNAADFVRQNLFEGLIKNPKFGTDVKTAFGENLHKCASLTSSS